MTGPAARHALVKRPDPPPRHIRSGQPVSTKVCAAVLVPPAAVLFILIATCAEITIVMCYFQLCNEDYHWWWRSFLSSGSAGLYLFLYAVWYFISKLEITGFVSSAVYFGCVGFSFLLFMYYYFLFLISYFLFLISMI